MGIPLFDETPEFEKAVTQSAFEAAFLKRELDSLATSGKAVAKVISRGSAAGCSAGGYIHCSGATLCWHLHPSVCREKQADFHPP